MSQIWTACTPGRGTSLLLPPLPHKEARYEPITAFFIQYPKVILSFWDAACKVLCVDCVFVLKKNLRAGTFPLCFQGVELKGPCHPRPLAFVQCQADAFSPPEVGGQCQPRSPLLTDRVASSARPRPLPTLENAG